MLLWPCSGGLASGPDSVAPGQRQIRDELPILLTLFSIQRRPTYLGQSATWDVYDIASGAVFCQGVSKKYVVFTHPSVAWRHPLAAVCTCPIFLRASVHCCKSQTGWDACFLRELCDVYQF